MGKGPALASDPRWLAAGAGGVASAVLALWAFRGMPLGTMTLWLSPLPLFMAALGFGPVALLAAVPIALLVLLMLGSAVGFGLYLVAFGVPVVLLALAWASRRGSLNLSFALLGLMPAGGIIAAATGFSGSEGGLEGALRHTAEVGLARMGLPAPEAMVAELVRVKAAAIAFWLVLALVANAAVAGAILVRTGVIEAAPRWSEARLPLWYPILPALAFGFWLAADPQADAVPLSVLLTLLVPLALQGLAAFHRRTRGLRGRPMLLGLAYAMLVILTVPAVLVAAGLGLYDIWARRAAPPFNT